MAQRGNPALREEVGSLVTLVAALQGVDGVVMASDSRATVGDPRGLTAINDTHTKLYRLTKYTGVAVSGASEIAAKLITDTQEKLGAQAEVVFVDDVLEVLRQTCLQRWGEWRMLQMPVDMRPKVLFLVAGLSDSKEPRIYLTNSHLQFAPQLFQNGHACAGIINYAVYLLHRLYSKGMTRKNLVSLAHYVVTETATQDPKVGGPIWIAEIDAEKGFTLVDPERMEAVRRRNEAQTAKLKEFFFGG